MADDQLNELKRKCVLAHRILTMTGSMGDMTGHVFVRVPGTDTFLTRCRNGDDVSPAYVQPRCLHLIDTDGNAAEDVGDWTIPPERYIGSTIMKVRPEINCVIHAHPPGQVLCSIIGEEIRPIVGAQNWGGSRIALGGIPEYPRSLLIHSQEIGAAMMSVMGNKDYCILKAHGNVVAGKSVEEATVNAIRLENIAKLTWQFAVAGQPSPDLPWDDWVDNLRPSASSETGMRGGAFWSWDYYVQRLGENPLIPRESTVDLEQY